ncbi:MAG: AMP-binding protein [Acidobacteria bacterium]|nr:AMP-binding protein [Acidobacteriota bacterium]
MIYRSPWPDIDIPAVSLADFVLAGATARGSRPALVDADSGRTITFEALPTLVDRAAAGLAALGVRQGDVVGVLSANSPEFVVAILAVARLGAIFTTINPLCTSTDLASQLADSGAQVLMTTAALQETWRASAQAMRHVILFDDAPLDGTTSFRTLLDNDGHVQAVSIAPWDLVALPYSSGTTGLPKGVMLTHRNIVVNILQVDAAGHARHGDDVTVAFLPFFHIYGLTVVALLGVWSGTTTVVVPRFDLGRYLEHVKRYRATLLHVVPPVVVALGKSPSVDGVDYAFVRKLFSGAAPLAADTIERCVTRMRCVLQQGYGLTEASPASHVVPESGDCPPGSIGDLLPNTEARIVDPVTHRDCETGMDGELWMRGPQVMRGYLNRPRDTADVLDEEGWLHTGDIAHVDAAGHFFVVDRLKELIKYKGLQVAPAELEAVLLTHPAVADAAVVPLPDVDAGEIPRAFVVLRAAATADELMAYVAARVAPYKKIRRIDVIDAIPKSASGKILRRLLRGAEAG